ncbi:CRISPR-associated protein Cas4 [Castellaniella sp. UC4442_H9]
MDTDDFIPLSALQHYLYCPRQCALIHLEQLWAESRYTAEGRLLHERADKPASEKRQRLRTVTAMALAHRGLGITGIADVVEFHACDTGEQPYPVEYKRGRPKAHRADEVQLCAQALCLEAMLDVSVPEGALYYGKTRRRKVVAFDDTLRRLTLNTVAAIRTMFENGRTPLAVYDPNRCDNCSLLDLCLPKMLRRTHSVQSWLEHQTRD